MKFKTFTVLILFILFTNLSCYSTSTENLYPIQIGDKFGYISYSGELVINPIYDRAYSFSEGLASVKKDGKYFYINEIEDIVFYVDGNYAGTFSEGLASFTNNRQGGYIDRTGNVVIPAQYRYAKDFSHGFAAVKDNGVYFYINPEGENIFNSTYEECYAFNEGYGVVRIIVEDDQGLKTKIKHIIDTDGKVVLAPQDFSIYSNKVSNGLIYGKKGNDRGFFTITGEMLINLGSMTSSSFSEGFATVYDDKTDKAGLIDVKGNWIIEPQYEHLLDLKEGLIAYQKDLRWGFLDIDGNEVITNLFREVLNFSKGMAIVNPRNGYEGGYVNKVGLVFLGKDYID